MLGAQDVLQALSLVRNGRLYDLDSGRWPGMPIRHGHPPFQVVTYRTPRGVRNQGEHQGWLSDNRVCFGWHSEMLLGTVHTGTHIDSLAHITCGEDDHFHGGATSAERMGDLGLLESDASTIPPIIARGVLIDVASARGVPALPAHEPIGPDELRAALERYLHHGDGQARGAGARRRVRLLLRVPARAHRRRHRLHGPPRRAVLRRS
jgi:hypothetical protein